MSLRKPINSAELVSKTCILSVALRKEWASRPTYWIELYARWLPGKRIRYWLVKHWHFKKHDPLTGTTEMISDHVVSPSVYTDESMAFLGVTKWIDRQLEKDYLIDKVTVEPDASETVPLFFEPAAAEAFYHRAMIKIKKTEDKYARLTMLENPVPVPPNSPSESSLSGFQKAQQERQKKAKW
jgi:hypothetical protein